MTGQFIWYELMSTDIERSASFFAGLLDCDVLQTDDRPPAYFLAPKGTESPLFGLVPVQSGEGVRSHWIGYLMVDDLDIAVAMTEEAGGIVHALSDEQESRGEDDARFAIVTDPQGAVVNLIQKTDGEVAGVDPGFGRLAWTELLTTDRESAADFYQNLTGWQVGPEHARGEEGVAHGLFRDERIFGLLRDLPAGSPVPPNWCYYLRVPDLGEAIKLARTLGGFMYEEAAQVDGGRRVLMLDPTGAPVALWASQ